MKQDPKIAKYGRLITRAFKAAELAHAYIEDGALQSGARCLREAADLFDKANEAKNEFMGVPQGRK